MRVRWRRGTYSWIFGVASFALLGFGAIGIDLFRVRVAGTQAQNVSDAAAMAALIGYRGSGSTADGEAAADAVASMNFIAEQQGGMQLSYQWGTWDWDAPRVAAWTPSAAPYNAVKVTAARNEDAANGEVGLWLAPAIGVPTSEVVGIGTAAMRFREVMLVLDITGSFRNEWGDAKAAILQFLQEFGSKATPGDKIGMAVFVGNGQIYTPLQLVTANYDAIAAAWGDVNTCHCWDEMFDNFYQYMSYSMDGGDSYVVLDRAAFDLQLGNNTGDPPLMPHCFFGSDLDPLNYTPTSPIWPPSGALPYYKEAGTSQGHGLAVAIEELRGSDDPYATKVIVIVSDGRPECTGEGLACTTARRDFGLAQAAEAWDPEDEGDSKIAVFSVSFNDPFDENQSEYMASLAQGWGQSYETPDSTDLEDMLVYIAQQIPTVVVN